jgi:Glyoxalase/Bleomycin resistance protein/Dioxygenase superfamily
MAAMDPWVKQDNRRMLHVVYRVGDMDATMKYYKGHFGMQQLRYRDMPDDKCAPRAARCAPRACARCCVPACALAQHGAVLAGSRAPA